MLWYKSWLETRWRFLIALGLMMCTAAATVFTYPEVVKLLPLVPAQGAGEIGRRIRESAELAREYRGYVWSAWFRQNLTQWGTLFAVLLGTDVVSTAAVPPATQVVFVTSNAFNVDPWISYTFP